MSHRKLNLQRAALEDHRRVGKELLPPFQQLHLPPEQLFWWRDWLPEFLWIDAIVHAHGERGAVHVFSSFLSAADRFNPDANEILDGTISAFRLIAEDARKSLLRELADSLAVAVLRPFGDVLLLYPDCPMAWMVTGESQNLSRAVAGIRESVLRLVPGKDAHAGFCRALPLHRLFAHKKVKISAALKDTIEAIRTYPEGDRYRAESFARNVHNSMLAKRAREDPHALDWPRSFWRSNLSLVPCAYE